MARVLSMADDSRMPPREVFLIVAVSPLVLLAGLPIPLLASFAWRKLRVPYIIGMAVLFALEMATVDYVFFAGAQRILMLLSHGIFLSLVVSASLLASIFEGTGRLTEGPTNVEGFVAIHITFILLSMLIPQLQRASLLAH